MSIALDTRNAMERDAMEECRSLLRRQRSQTFGQRFRRIFSNLPSQKAIGFGVLLCLFVSIVLILAFQFYIGKGDLFIDIPDLNEETDEPYNFSDPKAKLLFTKEWERGKKLLLERQKFQMDFYDKVSGHINESSFDKMQDFLRSGQSIPVQLVTCSLLIEHIKRTLKRCVNIDVLPEECKSLMRNPINCDHTYPYRAIDGSCNNLANPKWGMNGAPLLRWMKAVFSDDVSQPRLSVYGVELPHARVLTNKLYTHKVLPDAETTMLFMNFGLFLDHDIVRSAQPPDVFLGCCRPEVIRNPSLRHPACSEIEIPPNDPFFGPLNVTCMNFLRDSPTIGTCPGRREQMNVMTSYIDASDIYGPSEEKATALRAFKDGKLRTSVIGNTPMLPLNEASGDTCHTPEAPYKCFLSGDVRANMHLELMTLHAVWFREHNRLTDELLRFNPHWDDERLFQEARRIMVAELQLITYREFLPIIFGEEKMRQYDLTIDENAPYYGYDETVNAGIYNGFSTAAFRFGHSLIQGILELRGPGYQLRSKIPLHETYMNPTVLYHLGFDDIIRGMVAQRTHQSDSYITTEVRNRLLQRFYQDHGYDLTAISIKRGRDHGIPSYIKWRKFCGLSEVNSWDDMYEIMDKRRVEDLREMYMSVEDVDLIPAGLAEYHEKGAFVGPTYICLLGKQFHNLRTGDRFWFENLHQPGSFTREQLKEIYKITFSRILCDVSDGVQTIQKFSFLLPSKKNPVVNCSDLPKIDMSLWTE